MRLAAALSFSFAAGIAHGQVLDAARDSTHPAESRALFLRSATPAVLQVTTGLDDFEHRELAVEYDGPESLEAALRISGEPRSLASADFDEDGVPDLAVGHFVSGGGALTLHRGNASSIFPARSTEQPRPGAEAAEDPFLPTAKLIPLPAPADFLATGDFDADGHWDVVSVADGDERLFFLAGDGQGGVLPPREVLLPGPVTAVVAGEIDRADGLTDLAVGVGDASASSVLVFRSSEGALARPPEILDLPGPSTALALGRLDSDLGLDLVAGIGTDLFFVRGRPRSHLEPPEPEERTIDRVRLDAAIVSLAVDELSAGRPPRSRVTVRLESGATRRISHSQHPGPAGSSMVTGLAMRLNRDALPDLVVLEASPAGRGRVTTFLSSGGTTFTVNSADDTDDGTCDAVHCSLREAINAANATVGSDAIEFAIPGVGPHTIQPMAGLPEVTDPVVMDGYTQPGSSPNTLPAGNDAVIPIMVDGQNAGNGESGFLVSSGMSVIRGLTIVAFDGPGIRLTGTGDNVVEGNFIGTDASGADRGNDDSGITVATSANTVGGTVPGARNVISANTDGVALQTSDATSNQIQGNFIGTDPSGTASLGNDGDGVIFFNAGSLNVIGGAAAGSRNVISGSFSSMGVITSGDGGALIQGNFIGTDASGTQNLGNSQWGLFLITPANTIGGTSPALRNVISGNGDGGVFVWQGVSFDNVIRGNFIGTDLSGTTSLGNSGDGVRIEAAPANVVGGSGAGSGNVISANSENGLVLTEFTADTVVQGNFIGLQADGVSALGNGLAGVRIDETASANTIGGTVAGEANRIGHNSAQGIVVESGVENAVLSNAVGSNGGLGIDLGDDGVTSNDPGDNDLGANELQNFPLLTAASAGELIVFGILSSTPNGEFLVQFFAGDGCDPSGFGEGEIFAGSAMVTTSPSGTGAFGVSFPTIVTEDDTITATATDSAGNTSEFSPCIAAGGTPLLFADGFESGDTVAWSASVL